MQGNEALPASMRAQRDHKSLWSRHLRPTEEIQYGQDLLCKSTISNRYELRTLLVVRNQQDSAIFVIAEDDKNPIQRVFPLDGQLVSCVTENARHFQVDYLCVEDQDSSDMDDYVVVSIVLSLRVDRSAVQDLLHALDVSSTSSSQSRQKDTPAYSWLTTYVVNDDGLDQSKTLVEELDGSQESADVPRMLQNPFLDHESTHEDHDTSARHEERSLVRDKVLKAELQRRERDFIEEQSILVKCSTWNMGGEELFESLELLLGNTTKLTESCKLYGVAFQEIDSSSQAYLTINEAKSKHYQGRIEKALGDEYELVGSHQLVGIFLCVYAHISIIPIISQVEKSYVACGVLGMVGNKGGVGIRITVLDTTFAFISCHLAAGQDAVDRRNTDVRTILSGLFNEQGYWDSGLVGVDNLFLMGDLNYRINRSRQGVLDALSSKDIKGLLLHDQLLQQKRKNQGLSDWQEGQITFPPTYKFDIGTDDYDTSEKQRVPAWTDRILTKSARDHIELVQHSYKSVPEYYQSDHKPVVADFKTKIRAILRNMQTLVETETQRMLDRYENELIPAIRLISIDKYRASPNVHGTDDCLNFGSVRFSVPVQRSFTIRNTGHVPASFSFATEANEEQTCRHYLWPVPARGALKIGEEVRVQVTVLINEQEAQMLNNKSDQLPMFLILHTKKGPDSYIPMNTTWSPGCISRNLDDLAAFKSRQGEDSTFFGPSITLMVPSLLGSLCTAILTCIHRSHGAELTSHIDDSETREHGTSNALQKDCSLEDCRSHILFRTDASLRVFTALEDILLKGDSIWDLTEWQTRQCRLIDDFCGMLVSILSTLSQPVVPSSLYTAAIRASASKDDIANFITRLPPVHEATLKFLCEFLRRLIDAERQREPGIEERLCRLFGQIILRPPEQPLRMIRLETFWHDETLVDCNVRAAFVKSLLVDLA